MFVIALILYYKHYHRKVVKIISTFKNEVMQIITNMLDEANAKCKETQIACSHSTNPQLDCSNEREAYAMGRVQALKEIQTAILKITD